jgi:hypothetical protein
MASGEPFSGSQMNDIEQAVELAERTSGLKFAAYVGALADGRATALAMHAAMPDSASSVLVAVDPDARSVDVVTGAEAKRWLPDDRCQLAVLTMSSRFSLGDIPGGLRAGLVVLGEQANHAPSLFTDEPA